MGAKPGCEGKAIGKTLALTSINSMQMQVSRF